MPRTMQCLVLSLSLASVTAGQEKTELVYRMEPGLQLAISVEGTAEGNAYGSEDNIGKFVFTAKEKRELRSRTMELAAGETADIEVTGETTIESTFNGMSRDARTDATDPVVFTFDHRGQVLRTKVDPFEASPDRLMQFRWWRYIVQQLDLPPVLPEEPVARGATWTAVANLTAPDGKPLKVKQAYRFLGISQESEIRTAWLRGEIVVPLELSFKSDRGEYKVEGKARIDKLYSFDIEKGLPLGSIDRGIVDMSVTAKSVEGEELRIELYMRADGKTTMKPKTDETGKTEDKKAASDEKKDK